MTISDLSLAGQWCSGLAFHDRDILRDALSRRGQELRSALRLYEEAPISTASRTALALRTRAALADVEHALARLHDVGYGTCELCRQTLPLALLTRQPLATRCPTCGLLDPA
ncbi:MAG: hypothetical protein ACLPVY_26675 [Acidimicrobiia bacterium]